MARTTREVLLEEARDRHKLELARYTEAHTRLGVHLAVLAFFAVALLRFIDKPPQASIGSLLFWVFVVSSGILCVAILVVFSFVLAVIWGYGTRFPANMQRWRSHAQSLRATHAGLEDSDARVAEDLEQDLMESMCETADDNAAKNARRSRFIVLASRGLVVAAVAFVVSGATYLHLSLGREAPTPIHITTPVQVHFAEPRPRK